MITVIITWKYKLVGNLDYLASREGLVFSPRISEKVYTGFYPHLKISLRNGKEFLDVTLACDYDLIQAHKIIL